MPNKYGNGPTYGGQANVQAAEIAFAIHTQVDKAFYDVEYPCKPDIFAATYETVKRVQKREESEV